MALRRAVWPEPERDWPPPGGRRSGCLSLMVAVALIAIVVAVLSR